MWTTTKKLSLTSLNLAHGLRPWPHAQHAAHASQIEVYSIWATALNGPAAHSSHGPNAVVLVLDLYLSQTICFQMQCIYHDNGLYVPSGYSLYLWLDLGWVVILWTYYFTGGG